MFCKIKVFLVRCIGCSIEESFSRPAFREDLTTNVKKVLVAFNSASVSILIFL